jgi:hypothetical protein
VPVAVDGRTSQFIGYGGVMQPCALDFCFVCFVLFWLGLACPLVFEFLSFFI